MLLLWGNLTVLFQARSGGDQGRQTTAHVIPNARGSCSRFPTAAAAVTDIFLVQRFSCPTTYIITLQYQFCPSFNLPHLSPGLKANYLHKEHNVLRLSISPEWSVNSFFIRSRLGKIKESPCVPPPEVSLGLPPHEYKSLCLLCFQRPHSAFTLALFKEMWAQACPYLHRDVSF